MITSSILSYPERGTGGKSSYSGNCTPLLIRELWEHFGFKSCADYMCGSGTVEDVGRQCGFKVIAKDLNRGNNLFTDEITEKNEFIFWHPPYWDMYRYSGNVWGEAPVAGDISHIDSWPEFVEAMNFLLLKQYDSLRPGGRMAVLMGDIKREGKLYSMLAEIAKPGLENIVIKEQHNAASFRKMYAAKFIPIRHEYVMILRKPFQ